MFHPGLAGSEHLDPDASERAALGKMYLSPMGDDELEFSRIPRPEREAE